jgi:hypothetical protein
MYDRKLLPLERCGSPCDSIVVRRCPRADYLAATEHGHLIPFADVQVVLIQVIGLVMFSARIETEVKVSVPGMPYLAGAYFFR